MGVVEVSLRFLDHWWGSALRAAALPQRVRAAGSYAAFALSAMMAKKRPMGMQPNSNSQRALAARGGVTVVHFLRAAVAMCDCDLVSAALLALDALASSGSGPMKAQIISGAPN